MRGFKIEGWQFVVYGVRVLRFRVNTPQGDITELRSFRDIQRMNFIVFLGSRMPAARYMSGDRSLLPVVGFGKPPLRETVVDQPSSLSYRHLAWKHQHWFWPLYDCISLPYVPL